MTSTRQLFLSLGGAAALSLSTLLGTAAIAPAAAQVSVTISFDDFHSRLAPYGTWSNHPRWGEVWHPRVAAGFKPYYNGHWEDTREYGWLWVSDESWGDVAYHYGRWVYDPQDGWLWVPGYVWGPSWVVWREGDGNIGWFPMPPDDNYYGDGAYNGNYDNDYGYRGWYGPSFSNDQFLSLWIFVGETHFRDRNFHNYAVPTRNYSSFIGRTRDTTTYVTVNNYVVNRSIDPARLQQNTKQRFQPVAASTVIGRNALVTPATVGRQVEQRERKAHPIPASINPAEVRGVGNNGNGPGQANPQVERAVPVAPAAPAANANRPNGNKPPQGAAGRAGNANPGANGAGRANPAAPEAKTPENGNKAPQNAEGRGGNRNPGANNATPAAPQAARVAPTPPAPTVAPPANAPRQNGNRGPQDTQARGGNRNQGPNNAAPPKPQVDRAPAAITPPPNLAAAPPKRAAPPPDAKAVGQNTQTPPRPKAEGPPAPAGAQGNARDNAGRGNNQGDAKAADDKKKKDDGQN